MTTESIVAFLGSQERLVKVCNESSCLAELGRQVSADYVAQGRIGRFGNDLTIKVELYSVKSGNLIGSFTGDSKNIYGLRDIVNENAPDLFKKMLATPQRNTAPQPTALAPVAELPKSVFLSQVLRSCNLPGKCTEDFINLLGKEGFDMTKFAKELPQDVAKVRLKLKSPFGKPKDSDMTSSGLTVGCVKTLPESPDEMTSLLKAISLKMGFDLAEEALESVSAEENDSGEEKVERKKISFGIMTGLNLSHITICYDDCGDIVGVQLGAVVDFAPFSWFHIQPGLMYIQKGAKDMGGLTTHYLELPLLLSLKLSAFRLNTGPYIGLCLASDYDVFDGSDIGWNAGIGFDIGRFYIGVFYDLGLTGADYDMSNRTLGFNFGVNL